MWKIDDSGETRTCHYVYQGFNVFKDDRGKYVVIPSEEVADINELVGKYAYVKVCYYKVVNLDNNLEVDYEDGPATDDELTNDEAVTQSYNGNSVDSTEGPKLTKSYKPNEA